MSRIAFLALPVYCTVPLTCRRPAIEGHLCAEYGVIQASSIFVRGLERAEFLLSREGLPIVARPPAGNPISRLKMKSMHEAGSLP